MWNVQPAASQVYAPWPNRGNVKRLENWELDHENFTNEEQQKLWILLSHTLIGHGIFIYIKHKFKPHVGGSVDYTSILWVWLF